MKDVHHPESADSREELAQALALAEALLRERKNAVLAAEAAVADLRAKLAASERPVVEVLRAPPAAHSGGPRTPEEKVTLFRQLFRGRTDVYPTRFVAKKTGKPGYAPACANKFVRGVCELPAVKCGDCQQQAFMAVDDAALLAHLTGRHVMGVYPMLEDETCWLLAVDFDKGSWQDDVRAFVAACRRHQLPCAVERSRSGNGGHVWFFFDAPVAAATARRMGCHLITQAMGNRHELSMDSYDRLFPSQDTMPRGGFGNLIALPLQHEPRERGNSIFLDDELSAIPDDEQWAYLARVARVSAMRVAEIASEAARQGSVVGATCAPEADPDDATPWDCPPSGQRRRPRISGPLPAQVEPVLAQRIFVTKDGVPSPLLDQIKRLATLQNPEFYKKQAMRLPIARTPRLICCAEELPQHIALPRGCLPELSALLQSYGVALRITDQRTAGDPLDVRFHGTLTAEQLVAAAAILGHETGVLVAPPGFGKTVIGAHLVAARRCSTLVLVHRQPLLEQWIAQLAIFLDLDAKEIGQAGAGKRKLTGRLDVAMIQSLVRKGVVSDAVAGYGQVIIDECHHLPAVSFERVLAEVKARFVTGLTATPRRRDGLHPITQMQVGPTRHTVDARSEAGRRRFLHRLAVRETSFRSDVTDIMQLYAALAADETRNAQIIDDLVSAVARGRSPILLTVEWFATKLRPVVRNLVVLHGGTTAKVRALLRTQIETIPAHEERVILATGRYIGEGFDDARLDTLFLALPVSWRGTLVQYAGRLHRSHPGKREVVIYDYVDSEVPVLKRMFERRLRGYRAIGYAPGEPGGTTTEESSAVICEPVDEAGVVEADHDETQ